MRSATIYSALSEVWLRSGFFTTAKRKRQANTFESELRRRLDERDALTERNAFLLASAEAAQANLAACRRELAEARAYISTIIDAPGERV